MVGASNGIPYNERDFTSLYPQIINVKFGARLNEAGLRHFSSCANR
jgi:hypothetical protein